MKILKNILAVIILLFWLLCFLLGLIVVVSLMLSAFPVFGFVAVVGMFIWVAHDIARGLNLFK